eukprot:15187102-Alexandrium_andersonii.AAC.1
MLTLARSRMLAIPRSRVQSVSSSPRLFLLAGCTRRVPVQAVARRAWPAVYRAKAWVLLHLARASEWKKGNSSLRSLYARALSP